MCYIVGMDNTVDLNQLLKAFKIPAMCQAFYDHKNSYQYDIKLLPGARTSQIEKRALEISLALKSESIPQIKVLTNEGLVRLHFMKKIKKPINLFELGRAVNVPSNGGLNCLIGETPEGNPLWVDIVSSPHMLVAGCTGSGKSTLLHSIIANLLLYNDTKIILFDPKNIEFFKYNEISNKIRVINDYYNSLAELTNLCKEMEQRYLLMKERKISANYFPFKVLIIDEFADLISQDVDKKFQLSLRSLAQKSRSAGIYIILATQRPSVDIVDGSIKANFPTRISCKVATSIDSRVILDSTGAETLLGKGDSFIKNNEYSLQRFQGTYTTPDEVVSYFGNA